MRVKQHLMESVTLKKGATGRGETRKADAGKRISAALTS